MIKSFGKLTLAAILSALVVGIPLGVSAEDKSAPAPAAPASPDKAKPSAFRGTVGGVDKANKTIEVNNKNGEKRTFVIAADAAITKNAKSATLDDAIAGDSISGSYTKSADGKMVCKKVTLKSATAPAGK